jgi:mannose/fructose/N-acetylgalactosamine-specific phosphotransferase system component IIC
MKIALLVTVLGVGFFVTTVNAYFQSAKYKYLPKEQIKHFNVFNSPRAWISYSLVIALIIASIFITSLVNIMYGSTNVVKQQDTIQQLQQQQQTDTTDQSTN